MRSSFLAGILVVSLLQVNGNAAENAEDLAAQMSKLKEQMQQLQEKVAVLNSDTQNLKAETRSIQADTESIETDLVTKENHGVKLNGYMDSYYSQFTGPANAAKNDGFRIYRFSLIPNQQVTDKLRWLTEIEFEDAPMLDASVSTNALGSYGKIFLERAYVQYDINPMLKFRMGRDFAHSTLWSDDHYPTFVLPENRPLLERNIFPQINDGIEALGGGMVGNVPLDYIAYYGNGNKIAGTTDLNPADISGIRVRAQLPIGSFNRLSFAYANGGDISDKAVITPKNDRNSYAVGLEQKFGDLDIKAQFAKANVDHGIVAGAPGKYNLTGYYVFGSYVFGDFTPWAQYDVYEDHSVTNKETKRVSYGLQYAVSSNLKLKLEHKKDELKTISTGASLPAQSSSETLAAVALYF